MVATDAEAGRLIGLRPNKEAATSRLALALGLGLSALVSAPSVAQAGKCPNLIMLLDRSGSMLYNLSGSQTMNVPVAQQRWTIAKNGLTTIIHQYDGSKNRQGCFGGVCKDDPCYFITCPDQLECVAFEGTCQPEGGLPSVPRHGRHRLDGLLLRHEQHAPPSGGAALPWPHAARPAPRPPSPHSRLTACCQRACGLDALRRWCARRTRRSSSLHLEVRGYLFNAQLLGSEGRKRESGRGQRLRSARSL